MRPELLFLIADILTRVVLYRNKMLSPLLHDCLQIRYKNWKVTLVQPICLSETGKGIFLLQMLGLTISISLIIKDFLLKNMWNEMWMSWHCHVQWYRVTKEEPDHKSIWQSALVQNQHLALLLAGSEGFALIQRCKITPSRAQSSVFLFRQVWVITNVTPLCTSRMCL